MVELVTKSCLQVFVFGPGGGAADESGGQSWSLAFGFIQVFVVCCNGHYSVRASSLVV